MTRIDSVEVVSRGEQIAFVMTPRGGYLVTPVPDARLDELEDLNILARAESLEDAEDKFRRMYSWNI